MRALQLPIVFERLMIALFVLAIAVPLVGTLTLAEPEEEEFEENREPAPPPAPPRDWASLVAWPEAFTSYFADHFAFRSQLVRWQALFRVRVLGSSPNPDVILGRDGWLFYGADGAVEDFSGTRPFTEVELHAWRDTLQHTQDWLREQGIDYVFAIAPDKHAVYPEFMPDGVHQGLTHSRVEQLLEELRTHSTVRVVDLRAPVTAARNAGRLYHLTDTHWNDIGAFVAYRQVIERLGEPGGPAASFDDFERRQVVKPGLDLARMLGLKSVLHEEELQLEPRAPRRARVVEPAKASRALMDARVVTEQPGSRPRAVIFRDSFGSAMIPFLSEHFSRAVYVWQNELDPALVLQERPHVVLQEWVGRHLHTAAPYDAVAAWRAEHQH
jgi:alginate O-acetyltransferase complex protein AlgJ